MLLYALFDKFGDDHSKRKFNQVVSMTEVGKMIYEDCTTDGKVEEKATYIHMPVYLFTLANNYAIKNP